MLISAWKATRAKHVSGWAHRKILSCCIGGPHGCQELPNLALIALIGMGKTYTSFQLQVQLLLHDKLLVDIVVMTSRSARVDIWNEGESLYPKAFNLPLLTHQPNSTPNISRGETCPSYDSPSMQP